MELRIKEVLKERGLTIKDVAEKIGWNQSNLSSTLKNRSPKLSLLESIANAIGCDITELFATERQGVQAPREKSASQAVVLVNGQPYRLTAAKDVVRIPIYTNYSALRANLKGFIQRAAKSAQKKDSDANGFSLMGMVESYEVFTLIYAPETESFHLALCYGNGKMATKVYDARNEFCDASKDDDSWDTTLLYEEIRNDIEDVVRTMLVAEIE